MKANEKQIITNIANIIRGKQNKIDQLVKVHSITLHCTSDDYIRVTCELYYNNIVRYLISGTRSSMTITANTLTGEIVRKPRNIKPWTVSEVGTYAGYILERL